MALFPGFKARNVKASGATLHLVPEKKPAEVPAEVRRFIGRLD